MSVLKKISWMLVVLMVVFAGCVNMDCDDQMADVKARLGNPQEINSYSSGGYYNVDWWYWSRGVCYGFTWGGSNTCRVSKYTFTPLKVVTKATKDQAIGLKVLDEQFYCPNTSRPVQ